MRAVKPAFEDVSAGIFWLSPLPLTRPNRGPLHYENTNTFQLAGALWTVTQIQDYNLLGSCSRDTRQIILKKNVMQELKEQTFFHELIHAIYYMLGREDHDEKEVDLLATFLHHYLQTAKY